MLVELSLSVFALSPMASLLAHLRGMPCLCRLQLHIRETASSADGLIPLTNPRDVFLLSELTYFRYLSNDSSLSALAAGFAAPYLEDVQIILNGDSSPPILHLPRFIDDIEKLYRSAQVIFEKYYFRISLLTQTNADDSVMPPFQLCSGCSAV